MKDTFVEGIIQTWLSVRFYLWGVQYDMTFLGGFPKLMRRVLCVIICLSPQCLFMESFISYMAEFFLIRDPSEIMGIAQTLF